MVESAEGISPVGVLVIEPDPEMGRIVEDYLRWSGFKPVVCQTFEQAMGEVSEDHRFGSVVMDLTAINNGGRLFPRLFRSTHPDVPVILLTEFKPEFDDRDYKECADLGIDAVVDKDMSSLVCRIRAPIIN